MSHRRLRAAVAALVLVPVGVATLPSACADVVVLRGGETIPRNAKLDANGYPTPEAVLESASTVVTDFGYDVVKVAGRDVPAGQVLHVAFTSLARSAAYGRGVTAMESEGWPEAIDEFATALEDLRGAGRQEVLYTRILVFASANDLDGTLAAIDDLAKEFPKAYYFALAQIKRAQVLASQSKDAEVIDALKKVEDAPGMNARDAAEAAYTRVWLTKMLRANTAPQLAEAEKAFRAIADAIDANPKGKVEAADQRVKALARVGKCMALQGKADDARKLLDTVIAGTDRATDKAALAAAYTGRGDAIFTQVKAAQGGKKEDVKALCDLAVLDYLRIIMVYAADADTSDLFNAKQNAARLFSNLFTLSGQKDCKVAQRGYDYYREAQNMLPPNAPERKPLFTEGSALNEAMKKACGGSTPPK